MGDHPHLVWLLVYAVFGPGIWAFLVVGLVTARIKMGKLQEGKRRGAVGNQVAAEVAVEVAVIVPAHNEAENIGACLRSILASDYPSFRIIAVDDRSTDQTGEVMEQMAEVDPRLSALRIKEKPLGWMGKTHALHRGMRHCQGNAGTEADWAGQAVTVPWMLFVDSDCTISADAISRCMAQVSERGLDALSVLTRQRTETFAERLITPVACGAVVAMYLASTTNNDNRKSAFANGQFFLIRSETYKAAGGHEAVRGEACEDIHLMRRMKDRGAKVRLYSGDELAETRMYSGVGQMFKGWARIYSTASGRRPWRILVGMGFVLSGLGAFAMVGAALAGGHSWALAVLALGHLGLVLWCIGRMYAWSRNPVWQALLFPLTAVFLLGFYLYGLWWCVTNRLEWRGQLVR